MKRAASLALAGVMLCSFGCSVTELAGSIEEGVSFSAIDSIYVVKNKESEGTTALEDQLRERGFAVSSGSKEEVPGGIDSVVDSRWKWMWDLSVYLLELNLEFVDPDTGGLQATGRSYRTSLARKSPEFMVREILDKIFEESPGQQAP